MNKSGIGLITIGLCLLFGATVASDLDTIYTATAHTSGFLGGISIFLGGSWVTLALSDKEEDRH